MSFISLYHSFYLISFSVNEACTVPNITNGLIAPNRTGYTKFQEVKIICDDGFLLNTSVAGELSALSAFCSVPGIWVMDPTSPVDLQIAGCFRTYSELTKYWMHVFLWRML